MITLIDYGAGNLHSLEGALDRLGLAYRAGRGTGPGRRGGALVLPGVGHFQAAQEALSERGWWRVLPQLVADGGPCWASASGCSSWRRAARRAPKDSGLGLIPGIVRRLGPGVKVPHMGWAQVRQGSAHPALPDPKGGWLYFVHSYALEPCGRDRLPASHGRAFAAVEARGRVLGFQPHPEKSGPAGLVLLQSALAWMGPCPCHREAPCN